MTSKSDDIDLSAMATRTIKVKRNGAAQKERDVVVVEEPLEIRLGHGPLDERKEQSLSITMRTPGADRELGVGFLLTEGIIKNPDDVAWVTHCSSTVAPTGSTENSQNVLRVELDEEVEVDLESLQRHFYTTSSCGVCGKASLDALTTISQYKVGSGSFAIDTALIQSLPGELAKQQKNFSATGGIHAAASFDRNGIIQQIYEDVGRHNALDKLIGHYTLQSRLPMHNLGILLSGRISFELVQKVMMAGCPVVAAIGAPSSLAIDTADAFGIKMFGFLKKDQINQYT